MPTSTYVALQTTTLSASASSVTFSSIPSGYRDLILVMNGTGQNAILLLRFNGDSGSNYSAVRMYGTGSTTGSTSGTDTGIQYGYVPTAGAQNRYQIFDYSATDKHKSVLAHRSEWSGGIVAIAGRWANTDAITSIEVYSANNLDSGHTLSLYGIEA
jgi:hypothetical protein